MSGNRFRDRDGDWGTYRISGQRLTLELDDYDAATFTFWLEGNLLILTDEENNEFYVELERQ
jgi:hypothetical protein